MSDATADVPMATACKPLQRGPAITYPPRADGLAPLDSVAVPTLAGGDIVDFDAAARLGKVLFWDVQVGSDGQTACASCHFSAGADTRRANTMSPGPNGVFEADGVTAPGQTAVLGNIGNDDRLASQGVSAATFQGLAADPSDGADHCAATTDPVFGSMRQATDRNAPTVFGAALYRELFWDGRAHHVFNGVDPFGTSANAGAGAGSIALANGALGSQAVGPPVNAVEMSCAGRAFDGPNGLGAKLLARQPLAHQVVAADDSALSCMTAAPANGLVCGDHPCTYRELIAAAFGSSVAADAENQFSRIWGQAIAAYEAILIPDHTPLDIYLRGDATALTDSQLKGMRIFTSSGASGETNGNCSACHAGAEMSDATSSFAATNGLINVDGGDQGFHHTGVRPTSAVHSEDLGRAGVGPGSASYSVTGAQVDRGAFKTPQLRNIKLTAPYFHNGGKATIADVLTFYGSAGDFNNPASQLHAIVLLPTEAAALGDFLTNALTDCRVEHEQAPFDHPSIMVSNGPSLDAVGAGGTAPCP